jgi:hypothetical protein
VLVLVRARLLDGAGLVLVFSRAEIRPVRCMLCVILVSVDVFVVVGVIACIVVGATRTEAHNPVRVGGPRL